MRLVDSGSLFHARRVAIRSLGIALVLCAVAAPALASGTGSPREVVADHWTSTVPGTSTGRQYAVDFVNPADPTGKPPSVSHVHLQLPAGARFDTDAIDRCPATDAQLMLIGPAACPPASELGTMAITFDTGFPGPGRYLDVGVTFFNEHGELIFLSQDQRTGARTVSRATVTSSTLDADLPLLPGTPPDGADKTERATFSAASTARGNYLTTPPVCPASGEWVESETYTYRDGVTETAHVAHPCSAPAPRP